MLIKKTFSKVLTVTLLAGSCAMLPSFTAVNLAFAAEQATAAPANTRRTPALRAKVYEQLSRAQALADADKTTEALAALDNVKEKSSSMNSYELAMMYNFYAFIYYNAEQFDKAIAAFEQVVAQEAIPESLELSTLFSLAQLQMMQGQYEKTLTTLDRWEKLNKAPAQAKTLLLKAQAMYQLKDYQRASGFINSAVAMVEKEGKVPEENWLVLQRAVFYELKQPKQVAAVLEKMVRHYNQGKYWLQLSGMYGELGEEKKQLAILEAAHQQGFVTSGADLFNLAQLYYYHEVPVKGARVMEQAIAKKQLPADLRNLKFTASCWTLAKEDDKAIPVLLAAAKLAEDGEIYADLAQLYLNRSDYENAIHAAETALAKGKLRNPGVTYLVKGMAYFNQQKFNDALTELAKAEQFDSAKRMAQQWVRFVEAEKAGKAKLAAALSS
jgi:tetratricopeptide (TPR) repeat protein